MSLIGELLDAERQGWQALTSAQGASYYREHLADDAVMVFSSGVMTRAEALEAMASAPPWSSFEILDSQVVEADAGQRRVGVSRRRATSRPTGIRGDDHERLCAYGWRLEAGRPPPDTGVAKPSTPAKRARGEPHAASRSLRDSPRARGSRILASARGVSFRPSSSGSSPLTANPL
jgi:hypothetical protein